MNGAAVRSVFRAEGENIRGLDLELERTHAREVEIRLHLGSLPEQAVAGIQSDARVEQNVPAAVLIRSVAHRLRKCRRGQRDIDGVIQRDEGLDALIQSRADPIR